MPADLSQSFLIDPADLPREAVIFGSTPAMHKIRTKIEHVASSDLPVLIRGESGTGKEVIAKFLHARSSRREAPFVKVNCAAIPANLLESELFGYERGSFTGASQDRPGLVEIAEAGSLFLDEIGELDWKLQGKLLHLLQDGSYTRIGSQEERFARVRVICATNIDLQRAVEVGVFREDLFFRIDVVTLNLSPLRDRKCDIPQLSEYFLENLAKRFGRRAPGLNPDTLHLLSQWNWPGNLRELENWIARVIILGDDLTLGAELRHQMEEANSLDSRLRRVGPLKEASRRATSAASTAIILKTLQANRWNRRRTAEDLNMSYRSLLYKLREAGVPQRRRGHRRFPPAF